MDLMFITIPVIVIIAYIIKSVTGFGTSLLLIPVLSYYFDLKTSVAIAALGDVLSSGIIAYRDRQNFKIPDLKELAIGLFIGTIFGVLALNNINSEILKKFLAIFIITYLIIQSAIPKIQITNQKEKSVLGYIFGLIGGIFGGLFNLNGPAVFIYTNSIFSDKNQIRANMVLIFLADSIWRTTLFSINGTLNFETFKSFLILVLPALIIGILIGSNIDRILPTKHFHFASKTLLVISGLKLLLT